MTADDFLAFYPQFADRYPEAVLSAYVASANARFDEFGEDAEEARRLFTAHKLTLYARTVPGALDSGSQGGEVSFSALASSGDGTRVTSKRVDDVAFTYASGSASSASAASGLADLGETVYGLQLLGLLRLYSWPRYVP